MAARPSPFPGLFLMSLLALLLGGCDLFYNSMTVYYAQHTGTAEVTGVVGKSQDFLPVTDSGTILIPPGMTILGLILDNPQSLAVRQTLVNNTAAAGSVAGQQTGPGEIEVVVTGAEEGDDYVLTLQMQSPDGLRSFTPYVLNLKCLSFEAALLDFTIDGATPWDFSPSRAAFNAVVPYGTASVTLEGITVAPNAAIEIYRGTSAGGTLLSSGGGQATLSGVPLDPGNNDFYLLVTASSAYHTRGYNLAIYRQKDDSKAIVAFNISSPLPAEGDINEAAKIIDVIVPYGTPLNSMTAFVTHTGASVSPPSGTPGNFSTPQTYTVTAMDGTTANYIVTVTPAPSSAKVITGFYFTIGGKNYGIGAGTETGSGTLSGTNIGITVPYGTSPAALAPVITWTGASVNPPSGTAGNFSAPQAYTVTAMDGSVENYTVTVQAAAFASISVYSPPTNTLYSIGDTTLSTAGLVIHGTDSLGTTGIAIPLSDFTFTGFNTTTRGSKTITATHTNTTLSCSFSITVRNIIATLSGLAVKKGAVEYPLSPVFTPETGTYSVTVPYGTPSVTLEATLTADSYADFSGGAASQTINLSGDPGGVCGSGSVTVQSEDDLVTKTYTVTVSWTVQIISGTISFEDIPVITFSGGEVTVNPGEEITITVNSSAVTLWYVDIEGSPVTLNSSTSETVKFNAPSFWGFYTVNVIAEIDETLYSGFFTLRVE